jgi:hypothetical protein
LGLLAGSGYYFYVFLGYFSYRQFS